MKLKLFRQESIDNKKQNLLGHVVIYEAFSHTIATIISLIIVAMAAGIVAFGSFSTKQIAHGYIMPSKGVTKVISLQGGLVTESFVNVGDKVKKGDLLFTITNKKQVSFEHDAQEMLLETLEQDLENLKQKIAESKEYYIIQETYYHDIKVNMFLEISNLKGKLKNYQRLYNISKTTEEESQALYQKNLIAKTYFQALTEKTIRIKQDIQDTSLALNGMNRQLIDINFQLESLPTKQKEIQIEYTNQINNIKRSIIDINSQKESHIFSPVNGTISLKQVKIGKTVLPAESMLSIIPEDIHYSAVIFLPASAIGFIKKDQRTFIQYSAFPYQKFGMYSAVVENISSSVLMPNESDEGHGILKEPSYKVNLVLDKQYVKAYGEKIPLMPDMTFKAEVIIDTYTLYEWLMLPLNSIREQINTYG